MPGVNENADARRARQGNTPTTPRENSNPSVAPPQASRSSALTFGASEYTFCIVATTEERPKAAAIGLSAAKKRLEDKRHHTLRLQALTPACLRSPLCPEIAPKHGCCASVPRQSQRQQGGAVRAAASLSGLSGSVCFGSNGGLDKRCRRKQRGNGAHVAGRSANRLTCQQRRLEQILTLFARPLPLTRVLFCSVEFNKQVGEDGGEVPARILDVLRRIAQTGTLRYMHPHDIRMPWTRLVTARICGSRNKSDIRGLCCASSS
jgi:hypothetical protein